MDILINVSKQRLKLATNLKKYVSGSQEFVRFVFGLNSYWRDLLAFAQFAQNGNTYNRYLDDENAVYLPSEIVAGECTLTLFGSGNNVIATTNYLTLTIDENILVSDASSTDISESLYEQLVDMVRSVSNGTTVVDAKNKMTDKNKIYVYIGSETGMTNGNWYYWNGTVWISGGVWNAVAVETDKTLSVENKAADGKAAGSLVEVGSTQPTSSVNKIWINPTDEEVEIPEMSDLNAVDAKVNDLKSAVIDVTNRQLKLGTLIPNTYIQSSNGAAASWNGNSATDYLPCFMSKRLITHIVATNPYAENAFYTSSKTFISSFQVLAGQHEISVPANAYYVRFSNITENIETLSVHLYETCIATIFPATNNRVEFNLSGTTINFKATQMIGAIYVGQNNAFNSTYVFMDSAIAVPHDYWCIWDIDSNTIQAISDSNLKKIGNVRYCVLFYNSSGHVRGLFEKYVIENETDKKFSAVDILDWKSNGVCAPYGSADVSFSTSGTAITINCERYIVYSDSDHSWRMCDMTDNQTITVPHDYFLIYNYSTDKIEVKTLEQLVALPNQKYLVLFYNSGGKMCGPFEMYYSRYKISQYDKTYSAIYPSYYDVHMTTKLRIINQKLSTLSLGDAFVFITDIHYQDNKMYSPSLIRDVCNKTGINTVVLNGDYINRETNKNDALVKINRVCSYYEYPGVDTYRVVGNHEYNNPGASSDPEYIANELNASELRWSIFNPNQNKIVYDTNSLSYYFDNEAKKIRYFVGAVTKTSGITSASIYWIAEQVENVPEDYGVVVFLHTELSAAGGSVHVTNEYVSSLFDAMRSKGSYDGYNYAGKNFEFVACFCGDYHLDMAYTTTNGVKIIATTCDAMTQEGNLQRTAGTYTEQALDVVIIDRSTKKIHMVRIGAGDDRTFDY